MKEVIVMVLIIWNAIVFALYGVDKWRAINGKWRIHENNMILWAFLMGAFGAAFAMVLFHHKIRRRVFLIMIPLAMLENLAILYFFGRYFL